MATLVFANDYGARLYNFQAVETWSLCPTGWHVPAQWNSVTWMLHSAYPLVISMT